MQDSPTFDKPTTARVLLSRRRKSCGIRFRSTRASASSCPGCAGYLAQGYAGWNRLCPGSYADD